MSLKRPHSYQCKWVSKLKLLPGRRRAFLHLRQNIYLSAEARRDNPIPLHNRLGSSAVDGATGRGADERERPRLVQHDLTLSGKARCGKG